MCLIRLPLCSFTFGVLQDPAAGLHPATTRTAPVRQQEAFPLAWQAYRGADKAYAAIAARLRAAGASGGRFFLGARPCSLDALLFAHLLHHRSAPVSAPELRREVWL